MWEQRVKEGHLASILTVLADPPNLRDEPQGDDAKGDFQQWFDGGAIRILTGWTEYEFQDGTIAAVAVAPLLSIDITLPDGRRVTVRQSAESTGATLAI